ncbi:hypothetical protein QQS21_007349 [Conoideocrella luteorostrata]|uniref:Uncharacterized protein n=1 Tax=Conoideocrella luteorostrata TaxID=1105319 RepID=A0AAJ0CKW8_9HYPO|nr:hypothetical protein QQS21_007349 [Conoideocrella luteorostrata]
MAANMQQMAGAGQMMPQQLRRNGAQTQVQQLVYENILRNPQPTNGLTWQSNVSINDRMGKTMDLISNVSLALGGVEHLRVAEFGCGFEREVFLKSPSKEAYDQTLANKTLEFFKKRQANEPNIQNTLNANVQAQAQAAQAQGIMNMQAQMGRGMGQNQQGFQHLQHQMQGSQLPQQAQQQPQLQQQQMGMGMGMGMMNQAGRGAMGPNQQAPGMQIRQPQPFPGDISRLAPTDRAKVMDLAEKMMTQASDQQKATTRMTLSQRLSPQQLAEFQAQGRDPLAWFFQNQAFTMLKTNMNRLQQQQQQQAGGQNQNGGQAAAAAMMQQQHSQQSFQQRQSMMNVGQPTDFSQFNPNMESIKDQQMNGLMAQQAGQMVVPASTAGGQHATPQPGNQNIPNTQGQNQTPRQGQQPQQQQGGVNLQQMKMNQGASQSQNQLQMNMPQQNQQNGMPPSQSPGMNTLNTPVSRPQGGMNPMGGQGMGQGIVPFGDQRFNQGTQRPNNAAFNNMLANMTQEQRSAIQGLPTDKLNEVFRKWQSQRQGMAMNGAQMNQQNRPQNQFGAQMNLNMGAAGQVPQGMQQPNGAMSVNQQQQMQMPRMPIQNNQAQAMMDAMDLPPQVQNLVGQLPVEVKKWRDLKIWLSRNSTLPPQIRGQLGALQQRQFQVLMQRRASMHQQQQQQQQPGQNPNVNGAAMSNTGPAMPNQQIGMQRPTGNIPQHILQVTPQDLINVRNSRPNFAQVPDEQLRTMVMHMKRTSWMQQQQQQAQQLRAQQAQGQTSGQTQTPGQQQVGGAQNTMGQAPMQVQQTPRQQNRTPQPQTQASPPNMAQTASMQSAVQRQQGQANSQARNSNQAQPTKSLKRPSTDDVADTSVTAPTARPASQSNQQLPKGVASLTPQQIANLSPERRARYEQLIKAQMTGQNQSQQPNAEAINRLRTISQEEAKQFGLEMMSDISMSPQEYSETCVKIQRLAGDMTKVSRGLTKWYLLTRDDARAKMFFRTRLRIMRQFSDGEPMLVVKDKFSINSAEIDQARAMLESMAKDLAASMQGRALMKPGQQPQPGQGTAGNQAAQLPPQQQPRTQQQQTPQSQPAPLNAANLEKNSQALKNQQKTNGKGSQAPPAPTATQPPFPFGASSPHGNPSYIGKPKDINLQLPPARKKAKLTGQTPQSGATPSPKTTKNASPEMRRQEPPKPIFLCKEPDCDMAAIGFPGEQALKNHIEEEHTKPKEDPLKFVKENLALALGLEADGTSKKTSKPTDGATAMSASASKQGQTPKNAAATPMSQDNAMRRTGSALSKGVDVKSKEASTDSKPAKTSPWAGCTIDPQALLNNLGFEKGLPNIVSDALMYRSWTPNDTPESSKDSGSSEPNSDISEGAALEIDVNWQSFDNELLLDLNSTSLDGNFCNLDTNLLLDPHPGPAPDWDDVTIDFSKPFELDMSHYSMGY